MASLAHRRQVLLFIVAVVLPCAVLVALGVLIFNQERELRERRRADERRLVTRQIRRELSARLDHICLNEAARLQDDARLPLSNQYTDAAVALVARLLDGSVVLPWEENTNGEQKRQLLDEATFAHSIAEGELAEFAGGKAHGASNKGSARASGVANGCFIQGHASQPGDRYAVRAVTRTGGRGDTWIRVRWQTEDGKWIAENKDRIFLPDETLGPWREIFGVVEVPDGAGRLVILLGVGRQESTEDIALFDDVSLHRLP